MNTNQLQNYKTAVHPTCKAIPEFLPNTLVNPLILLLTIWEVKIGIGFLSGKAKWGMLILLLVQMAGAMSPLITMALDA